MDTSSAESSDRLQQAVDDETNSLEEPAIESTWALRSHHNAFAPISRLPPEILALIFSLLSPSAWDKEAGHLAWMYVTHVCRRWREIALNYPHLWSHIDFTKLTPAGSAEFLARAKMVPLHLEADVTRWGVAQFGPFRRQLEAHISHTRHLSIRGPLETVLERLVSSAPILESLSLSHEPDPFWLPLDVTPVNLFDCTAPNLISLELESCDISWKSPLLKGLRTLKILKSSPWLRLKFEDWLDALNEMPQLSTLVVQWTSLFAPLEPESSRPVTLPSLTRFHIAAPATDCALALAHLALPALTWLHVDADSRESEGEDVRRVIPYIARNVNGTEPLRSLLISGERIRAEVVAWSMPDADIEVCDPKTLSSALVSARLVFSATNNDWFYGVDTAISDALLKLLPVDSISTLTAHNHTRLSKEFWLSHALRWPLLERARLVSTAIKAFKDMLAEDPPPDGPRLPSLKKLILVKFTLNALRTFHLRDMLIERVEQGVPLEVLDLRTCVAAASDRTIQLLAEIVVDVQEPLVARPMMMEDPRILHAMNLYGEAFYCEYDDVQSSWYGDSLG